MIFENKVAVITGGASGIGKCICEELRKEGAHVCLIDLKDNPYFVGDLADDTVLQQFVKKVIKDYGHVDYLINNALPLMKGINDCTYEDNPPGSCTREVESKEHACNGCRPVANCRSLFKKIFTDQELEGHAGSDAYRKNQKFSPSVEHK